MFYDWKIIIQWNRAINVPDSTAWGNNSYLINLNFSISFQSGVYSSNVTLYNKNNNINWGGIKFYINSTLESLKDINLAVFNDKSMGTTPIFYSKGLSLTTIGI